MDSEPAYTVFIRLPFPRGDFVDPPPVSAAKAVKLIVTVTLINNSVIFCGLTLVMLGTVVCLQGRGLVEYHLSCEG